MRSLHKSTTACPSLGPAVPVPLLPGSMKKDFNGHPSITPQLEGYGAPKPSATSNEDPLIAGRMRTFPDNHPSLGSVRNAKSLGCPALIFNQMTSDQWKSTTQAQIGERQPTFMRIPCSKGFAAPCGGGTLLAAPRSWDKALRACNKVISPCKAL